MCLPPRLGRLHQLGEILAGKGQLGGTILMAAASSESVETFWAVFTAATRHLKGQQVRDVCGVVAISYLRHQGYSLSQGALS